MGYILLTYRIMPSLKAAVFCACFKFALKEIIEQ